MESVYDGFRELYGEDGELMMEVIHSGNNTRLDFRDLNIHTIPRLPEGVKYVICSGTSVRRLPPLPSTLIQLNISETRISELPSLPEGLEVLWCAHTNLRRLPPLPQTLRYLDISCTDVDSLPELPENLETLLIGTTLISELPQRLPRRLRTLVCKFSGLEKIPPLPETLKILDISSTSIWELTGVPSGLQVLDISCTDIKELPSLPLTLINFLHNNVPLYILRDEWESIATYNLRWDEWREEQSASRIQGRCFLVKEELMMRYFEPERFEKRLEEGGWDAI